MCGLMYLLSLCDGRPGFHIDDIDHLENRRVRSVGELVYDKVKVGLARMEKIAKDRMTIIADLEEAVPGSFINSRPMIAVMREFLVPISSHSLWISPIHFQNLHISVV